MSFYSSSYILKLLFLLSFSCSWPALLLSSPTFVTTLPGFSGNLPFRLETGYVTVDEENGSELFYYFIESDAKTKEEDPVLLWLTGGPGCSSLFGLYQEIGPVKFKSAPYDITLPTLVRRNYTWTKISSIIFLDWPPGSGFSFSRSREYQDINDDYSVNLIYKFLKQWLLDHPNFLSNPFYVAGDSYGGKMVTLVTYRIAKGIEASEQPLINLKGYLIGNPRTGVNEFDVNSRVPRAHDLGIISDEFFQLVQESCFGDDYYHPKYSACDAKIKVFDEIVDEIVIDNILAPKCIVTIEGEKIHIEPPTSDLKKCSNFTAYLAAKWANERLTQEALGIKEGTVKEWKECNYELKNGYWDNIGSSLPHHNYLISHGYRALVYSGDHDLDLPFRGTMEWIESLSVSVIEKWRSWHVHGQVAGYTVLYSNNLTFATVKGAGHEAPQDRPKECWAMLKRWISYKPL